MARVVFLAAGAVVSLLAAVFCVGLRYGAFGRTG